MKQTQSKWSIKKTKVFHDDKRVGTNFDIYEGHELNVVARVRRGDRNLVASAPEMLELLKDILVEVRPEISRVNEAAGRTIFNPVATETIDMAKELIAKAEGK